MDELEIFDKIKIGLASDEKIREWSRGEVKKPETINYRTLKPEKEGLFCEKIFGPTKDWECHCGKYKRVRYKGIICDRCGVEVTKSKVRRERMGHIELAAPIAHIWYFKGIPNRIALMLDISPRNLEKVIYFAAYVVTEKGTSDLLKHQILNEKEYHDAVEKYGKGSFKAEMGAQAIRKLLAEIDVDKLAEEIKKEMETATEQKKSKLVKRLDTVESFRMSGNRPEWMVLEVVPVIPPELRPMVQLDGGRFATSDLNDLYRRVINRNNRLKRLLDLGAPEIIVRNEKRMLQESVDALIDNGRRGKPVTGAGNRPLKSLSDMLKGKTGRFRQNLLGKRVDYSGRSVIVVGPELKIYQCGVPKEMAVELFKPFVMKELVERGLAHNIKNAKRMVEKLKPEVWDILEEVIQDHPVMLNRAPTLHRLGIQAFEPVLVEGRAIKLHPLVCTAFNADFDGDQMAIHVPLSPEAQAEARFLMLSVNNLLKPQDGNPVAVPTQDMILGSYYLTMQIDGEKGEGMYFKDKEEALMAYHNGDLELHAKIKVRMFKKDEDGTQRHGTIETTVGRIIYNEGIPQNLGFVDRTKPENEFKLEIEFPVIKKNLGTIIAKCINANGLSKTAEVLDYIKSTGYKYSTKGAITVSVADVAVPEAKREILAGAEHLGLQHGTDEGADVRFILHDQNFETIFSHDHSSIGSVKVNSAPPPGRLWAEILPPWALMMVAQTLRPMPMFRRAASPWRSEEPRYPVNRSSSRSSRMPQPSSRTKNRAARCSRRISSSSRLMPTAWMTAFSRRFASTCSMRTASMGMETKSSGMRMSTGCSGQRLRNFTSTASISSSRTVSVLFSRSSPPSSRVTERRFSTMPTSHWASSRMPRSRSRRSSEGRRSWFSRSMEVEP